MSFAAPWALVGLLLVPVLVLTYRRVRARRAGRRAALAALGFGPVGMPSPSSAFGGAGRGGPGGRRDRRARAVPVLLGLGLGLLVVAAARPQATVADVHREGTVILAIDTSTSMRATDLAPNRLDAARAAIRDFVAAQPPSIKIGVVAFGDGGLVMQAPTSSQADVLAALDRLKPGGGTSLGKGIYASLQAISGGKLTITDEQLAGGVDNLDIGHFASAHIVLISDGEDTSRLDPMPLARLAGAAGVRIDTVGLGSPDGATLQVDGFSVSTSLDEAALTEIAQTTGGSYLGAPDAASLATAYDGIDLALTSTPVYTEVGALFAAAAMLLVVLGAALSILRTGRVI